MMQIATYLMTAVIAIGMCRVATAGEAKDQFGKPDKITVEIARQPTAGQWKLGVFLENDEELAAITVPISFGERLGRFRLDSVVFANTRTSYFGLQTTNSYDTLNRVLIGLLYTLGGNEPPLEPGSGPVAWVFLTASNETGAPSRPPVIDSTFFPPYNTLELVTPSAEPIKPIFETIVVERLTEYDNAGAEPARSPGVKAR